MAMHACALVAWKCIQKAPANSDVTVVLLKVGALMAAAAGGPNGIPAQWKARVARMSELEATVAELAEQRVVIEVL